MATDDVIAVWNWGSAGKSESGKSLQGQPRAREKPLTRLFSTTLHSPPIFNFVLLHPLSLILSESHNFLSFFTLARVSLITLTHTLSLFSFTHTYVHITHPYSLITPSSMHLQLFQQNHPLQKIPPLESVDGKQERACMGTESPPIFSQTFNVT